MRKRCKMCAHWDAQKGDVWGYCLLAGSSNAQPDNSDSLAVAYDFEGYSAGLQTDKSFGCVQWSKKDKAE